MSLDLNNEYEVYLIQSIFPCVVTHKTASILYWYLLLLCVFAGPFCHMGMKHWWWRTRVSHCSNIMASLFIHEMAAIIWDSCNDFYHCNGFFNCPCNSCHQKIIFQNKEKTFKAWKNFSRLCHTAQIVLNLYNITFSKPWSRIPFTEKIKLYCKALYYSHSLSRWQLLILIFFWYKILKIIIEHQILNTIIEHWNM